MRQQTGSSVNVVLADEKGTVGSKAVGMWLQGHLLLLTGKAADAVQTITSAITALRSTGATGGIPMNLSIWEGPMQNLDNSRTLGAALAQR